MAGGNRIEQDRQSFRPDAWVLAGQAVWLRNDSKDYPIFIRGMRSAIWVKICLIVLGNIFE
jgi:hypothetical protein